tara:strand:+ start:686 stop:928 length:243 start_codon:yes stop_codon:yes gene_type:complete
MNWEDTIKKKEDESDLALALKKEPKMTKKMLEDFYNALALSREIHYSLGNASSSKLLKVFEDIEGLFAETYPDIDLQEYR